MEPDGPQVHPTGAPEPPPKRTPPRLVLVGIAAATVIAGFWLFQSGEEQTTGSLPSTTETVDSRAPSTSQSSSVMPDTPWVLVFDDGLDGVVVLDPNDPAGSHRTSLEGQRPGDQPYRLDLVNNHLIVGWDQIYAVDVDSGESTLIGEATIFVPAAESDRVWLVDYPDGSIGSGRPRVWQASVTGEELSSPIDFDTGGLPEMGIPGGLAAGTGDGISLWDAASREVIRTIGSGDAYVSDVTSEHEGALAWCDDSCDQLHVSEFAKADSDQALVDPGGSSRFIEWAARFSGDGRYLAAPTNAGDVVILDRDTGKVHIAFSLSASSEASIEWAPSGYELFARAVLPNGQTSRIAHHMIGTGRTETLDVTVSMARSFVIVSEEDARSIAAEST